MRYSKKIEQIKKEAFDEKGRVTNKDLAQDLAGREDSDFETRKNLQERIKEKFYDESGRIDESYIAHDMAEKEDNNRKWIKKTAAVTEIKKGIFESQAKFEARKKEVIQKLLEEREAKTEQEAKRRFASEKDDFKQELAEMDSVGGEEYRQRREKEIIDQYVRQELLKKTTETAPETSKEMTDLQIELDYDKELKFSFMYKGNKLSFEYYNSNLNSFREEMKEYYENKEKGKKVLTTLDVNDFLYNINYVREDYWYNNFSNPIRVSFNDVLVEDHKNKEDIARKFAMAIILKLAEKPIRQREKKEKEELEKKQKKEKENETTDELLKE